MEYIVAGIIVGAFIGVSFYIAKKDVKKDAERAASMTDYQKQTLIETPDVPAQGLLNAAVTQGIIYEVKRKGTSDVSLIVMFYNRYYPNLKNQFQHADICMKAEEFGAHCLKEGDYVKLLLNEHKSPKLVF
ncbi:hypothetical protein [Ruminococcus sp. Marseille-P6503]|uniref:hypothetical protein n=1 Tax=Ruminococcus sp. Marseille-P6503 TaxID=2364796 RepID=UPI000F54B443|nr:hypothetical protein [Ruminococcus sp. Marseille-P6503]